MFGMQNYLPRLKNIYYRCRRNLPKLHRVLSSDAIDKTMLPYLTAAAARSTQPSTLRGTVNEYQLSG